LGDDRWRAKAPRRNGRGVALRSDMRLDCASPAMLESFYDAPVAGARITWAVEVATVVPAGQWPDLINGDRHRPALGAPR
jgi:hypothetical protein